MMLINLTACSDVRQKISDIIEPDSMFDISDYIDKAWTSEDLTADTYILEIKESEANTLSLQIKYCECGEVGYIAEIYQDVSVGDFKNNTIEFGFVRLPYNPLLKP